MNEEIIAEVIVFAFIAIVFVIIKFIISIKTCNKQLNSLHELFTKLKNAHSSEELDLIDEDLKFYTKENCPALFIAKGVEESIDEMKNLISIRRRRIERSKIIATLK